MIDRERRLEAALHAVYELDAALRAVCERLELIGPVEPRDPAIVAAVNMAQAALLRAEVVLAGKDIPGDE